MSFIQDHRLKDVPESIQVGAFEQEVLRGPLPTTPDQLSAECQVMRRQLDPSEIDSCLMVANSAEVVERLWRAMRLLGGAVPNIPDLPSCELKEARADWLHAGSQGKALNRALDAVAAWCEAKMGRNQSQQTDGNADEINEAVLPELISAADLAKLLSKSVDQVDAFLRRYRKKYPDCYRETEGRKKNEARILYRMADVLPHLKALKNKQK